MRRLTTLALGAILGTLLMAGCVPDDAENDGVESVDPASIGWSDREAAVADVLEEAPCSDARLFQGDPYFQGEMYGFGCYDAGGTPLHFRVYKHEGSAQNVVAEWDGLITPEYQVALGADWFAVGAPDSLEALGGIPQLASAERLTSAPAPARPISDGDLKQQICISYVTSAVEMAAEDASSLSSAEDLNEMYPDISTLIVDTHEDVQASLEQSPVDSLDVLAAISEHWQTISDYCTQNAQGVHFVDDEEK
ncbi:hypothetical protein AKG07_16700 [Microbacterium sp. CGR1]|uniref:hypothetical protein n=1 Tax=Microbacterium sp. CGR1 TaxID=1696072 RepID=UPI00069F9802|nr:hypothetical protein [Microbacterium sp. CGR1]AKV87670.1 hypothetical protein AKG07_16700 [Microbacterium sp. CGR1]